MSVTLPDDFPLGMLVASAEGANANSRWEFEGYVSVDRPIVTCFHSDCDDPPIGVFAGTLDPLLLKRIRVMWQHEQKEREAFWFIGVCRCGKVHWALPRS